MASGQRLAALTSQQAGGAELSQRDCRRHPSRGGQRPPQMGDDRLAPRSHRRRAERGRGIGQGGVDAPQHRHHRAHDEGHGHEGMSERDEPPRRPPIERCLVERDQHSQADRDGGGGRAAASSPASSQRPRRAGGDDGQRRAGTDHDRNRGRHAGRAQRPPQRVERLDPDSDTAADLGLSQRPPCLHGVAGTGTKRPLDQRDQRGEDDRRGQPEPSPRPADARCECERRVARRVAATPRPGCGDAAVDRSSRRRPPRSRAEQRPGLRRQRHRPAVWPAARSRPRSSTCRHRRAPE